MRKGDVDLETYNEGLRNDQEYLQEAQCDNRKPYGKVMIEEKRANDDHEFYVALKLTRERSKRRPGGGA